MSIVWAFIKPWLLDKSIWVSGAMWLFTLANAKLGLGLTHDTMVTLSGAVSAAAVGHLAHAKFLDKVGL